MKHLARLTLITLTTLGLMACQSEDSASTTPEAKAKPVVNVYSYRQENLIKPALDNFSRSTGIQVNLVTGKADALFQRLQSEGANSPADVLITADAGRLYRAKQAELLQAIESDTLQQRIPAELRDSDNQWFGLSRRARVIFYNKEAVNPKELGSYLDLTDKQWEGRICIRSSSNIYNQSLLASLIAHHGSEAASEWAAGMVANMARDPQGGDRDQLKGAAVGVCDIAVANTYYYGSWVDSADETDRDYASRLAVHYPNQGEDENGAHINVSGAGVTRHAPNREAAIALIEYLSGDEAQRFYASANHEYPVVDGVAVSDIVKSWGYPFKADDLSLNKLGQNNAEAVRIFDRVGWK